jgi:molybdate transport system ATP-binding protein
MANNPDEFRCKIRQQTPIPLQLDFSCQGGEILAIVGPSGGGKTSLLRMLAGLSQPQEGFVSLGDELWFDNDKDICLSPQQRHIGYVPQQFGLFPRLTALENVLAGLGSLPKSQRRQQALTWLQRVGLGEYGHRLPKQLSGGQKQRVALARALSREPKVLLLDEPFSALDMQTRDGLYQHLMALIDELAIPIILVTHDIQEAFLLADKILLLHQGQMLQRGAPAEIWAKPVNELVARQMGHKNILPVECVNLTQTEAEFSLGDQTLWLQRTAEIELGSQFGCVFNQSSLRLMPLEVNQRTDASEQCLWVRVIQVRDIAGAVRLELMLEQSALILELGLNLEFGLSGARLLDIKPNQRRQLVVDPSKLILIPS